MSTCGANHWGRLGRPTIDDLSKPEPNPRVWDIVCVVCGDAHAIAVKSWEGVCVRGERRGAAQDRMISVPRGPAAVSDSTPKSPSSDNHDTSQMGLFAAANNRMFSSSRKLILELLLRGTRRVSQDEHGPITNTSVSQRDWCRSDPWRCRARRDGTAGRRVHGSKTVLCLEGPDLLPALPRHFIDCSCFLFKAVLALPLPFQRLTRLILQADSSQTNVREP